MNRLTAENFLDWMIVTVAWAYKFAWPGLGGTAAAKSIEAEVRRIRDDVKGNRWAEVALTESDMRLMAEATLKRAGEILANAEAKV